MRVTTDDGVELNVEVEGDGPPLVLVHGITESLRAWDPLVPALAATSTVVRVDLRGHGESGSGAPYDTGRMAADVGAVVAEVAGGGPVDLIGHSLGGVVVTAYASALPTRRVVVIDQPLRLAAFREQLLAVEEILRGPAAGVEAFMTAMFDDMAGPLGPAERERLHTLRRTDPEVVLGIWGPVLDGSLEELDALVTTIGASVTAPLLALHGIDPGPDYDAWLTGIIGSARVERWPDTGHHLHLHQPERFLALTTEFLGR